MIEDLTLVLEFAGTSQVLLTCRVGAKESYRNNWPYARRMFPSSYELIDRTFVFSNGNRQEYGGYAFYSSDRFSGDDENRVGYVAFVHQPASFRVRAFLPKNSTQSLTRVNARILSLSTYSDRGEKLEFCEIVE